MPTRSPTFLEVIGLLFGGGFSSWLITHLYYRKQKSQGDSDARALTLFLYQIWKQGGRIEDAVSRASKIVDSLGITNDSEARAAFENFGEQLDKSDPSSAPKAYFETALVWKGLADRIADNAAREGRFKILSSDGTLSKEGILEAHQSMFPKGYTWSGTWRDVAVYINRNFRPDTRAPLGALSSIQVQPIPPEDIDTELKRLLDGWNRNCAAYKTWNKQAALTEVARFHHEFALIHPFFDGNGRIGRALMAEQVEWVCGVRPDLFADYKEYLMAMQRADTGSLDRLVQYIDTHIPKS